MRTIARAELETLSKKTEYVVKHVYVTMSRLEPASIIIAMAKLGREDRESAAMVPQRQGLLGNA